LFDRAGALELTDVGFEDGARKLIVAYADGDARRLLNIMDQVRTAAHAAKTATVTEAFVQDAVARSGRRFDKGGEEFYDQISALHKSVRGSNPDASLYWFVRMLDGGADPLYLGRRVVRMASEDIGLADPRALRLALDAVETYERLGSPEGDLALAQAVVYMACAPKSNAVYVAYNTARDFVRNDKSRPVPIHLRNAPTKLMKELGYGKAYRYAHDEPEAYAAGEDYFPEGMPEAHFYEPTPRGLEGKIAERLAHLRELDAKAKKKQE
jgi:putative ATPase